MRKYLIIIVFIQFAYKITIGQCDNSQIENKIRSLKASGVDTVIYYNYMCAGIDYAPDFPNECTIHETKYIYWVFNCKTYVQKFDNCFKYNPIILDSSSFISTFFNNINIIKAESIKPVEHHFRKTTMMTSGSNHGCSTNFRFSTSNEIIEKQIGDFELQTKMVNEKYKNDNYDYNQKTILKKLKDLAEIETKLLNPTKLK